MIIGFDFIDDNAVHWAGKLVFQPGASTFIVYGHENINPSSDVSADGYWDRINGVFDLASGWDARTPDGIPFMTWIMNGIFHVLPGGSGLTFWDNVNAPGGTFTPSGWRAKQENYDAFATFLAQPRIKDPCKGWSAEELLGPYTNACSLQDLVVGDSVRDDNLLVRPRAIMKTETGITTDFVLNLDGLDGPPSNVFSCPDLPIGTIIPIRPIGVVGTPAPTDFIALW